MRQINEKYRDVVTQHFLGMTYENQPMYYLKVSEKAENYLGWGEESSLPPNPRVFVYHSGALIRNMDKVQRGSAGQLCLFPAKWVFTIQNR